jgi:hypothetical protein
MHRGFPSMPSVFHKRSFLKEVKVLIGYARVSKGDEQGLIVTFVPKVTLREL